MGIRVNPLTVMITTASEKLESPFRDTLKSYKKILRGEMENDSVFAHIFEPDVKMKKIIRKHGKRYNHT